MEYANDPPATINCQAGFVPPLAPFNFEPDHNSMSSTGSFSSSSYTSPPPSEDISSNLPQTVTTPRRNMGGRRPTKSSNISPEEEEKRKVRRERNKLAAARCRKRRVDHTNELVDEVDGLEKKRQNLQNEINALQSQKEDLLFVLDTHKAHCRMQQHGRSNSPLEVKVNQNPNYATIIEKIKTEPIDFECPPSPKRMMMSSSNNPSISQPVVLTPTLTTPTMTKPNRPSSLNVPMSLLPPSHSGGHGVPIQTPSTGIFNFESLMDGGTGLTPLASGPLMPNCSMHNRNPLDLVTPTSEPSKLVSL